MTVQCPWCDYEGMVPSVEAHISGKADEVHRGKVGHDLRDHLPQTDDSGEESNESTASAMVADLPESDEESNVPPGWALVAATVLFLVVVLAVSMDSDSGEEDPQADVIDEDEEAEDAEQMALIQ